MRVDVSNDVEATLFDSENTKAYYSSWQLLLAAEIADMGIYCRVNLAEDGALDGAQKAIREQRIPDRCKTSISSSPIRCMHTFNEQAGALDAAVWFAEETNRALNHITKNESGRFFLTGVKHEHYLTARRQAAVDSSALHHVGLPELIELCRFLTQRWSHWDGRGRPLIAEAYKDVLVDAVRMAQLLDNLDFQAICDRVGLRGRNNKSVLRTIWPDWRQEEKERVAKTLHAQIRNDHSISLEQQDIDDFATFLADHYLETFFWRLRSFEEHAFSGHDFSLEGMKSDLQGMAVCVEHVARTLGGTHGQLYGMFKQLWKKTEVRKLLKRSSTLARQGSLADDWPEHKARIDELRNEGDAGEIAADLVMAHRLRGAVHHQLPEDDPLELERLFVTLIRAAALTFKEVREDSEKRIT